MQNLLWTTEAEEDVLLALCQLFLSAKGVWDFVKQTAGRPASPGGAGLPVFSQLPLQPGSHFCVLYCRKEGDSEFMNIIANEIGSEVRGAWGSPRILGRDLSEGVSLA